MTDYSTAASEALDALNDSGGQVEEYEVRTNGRRVRRGTPKDQLQAALTLNFLAARSTICNLAKPRNPQ